MSCVNVKYVAKISETRINLRLAGVLRATQIENCSFRLNPALDKSILIQRYPEEAAWLFYALATVPTSTFFPFA